MPRANSGWIWIRSNPRVPALLRSLADGETPLEHAALDDLPASQTVEYIRELLVNSNILPPRDRHLATFRRWLQTKKDTIASAEHRALIERFTRWDVERKLTHQASQADVSTMWWPQA
jgi:hypothetical protein